MVGLPISFSGVDGVFAAFVFYDSEFMEAVFDFADHDVHLDALTVEDEDYEECVC